MEYPARVALVIPNIPHQICAHLYPHALHQASLTQPNQPESHYPWYYAQSVVNSFATQVAPALLAARGVDVIYGNGSFSRKPILRFNLKRRSLCAKKYLLAMGSQPQISDIKGLNSAGYVTLSTLGSIVRRKEIPQHWAIVGDEAIGVELAQAMRRLGYQVTLLVEATQILPEEDPDAVALIQAQLEASGVMLFTQAIVTEAGVQGTSKYLVVNNKTINVDEIFLAVPERPLVSSYNLIDVKVEYDDNGVLVDDNLRTSNNQIWACGSVCGKVLGGYYGEHLAGHEAQLAIRNALSRKSQKVNYHKIPWVVFSNPPLARVGITVRDARLQFQQRLSILQANYQENTKALIAETDVGFVKILVRRSGRIVGATIVGQDAVELMQIIALAIHHRLSITDLAKFIGVPLSHTYLVVAAAQQWRRPSRWLQLIDPCQQWWADRWRQLGNIIERWRFPGSKF